VKIVVEILTDRRYTYEEWLELDTGDVRTELIDGYLYKHVYTEVIDGEVYSFSAPNLFHQRISGELFAHFRDYLKGKACEVFATINVKLEQDTLFIPDLVVVCDKNKLDIKGCNGTPDLVIEILSPSTSRHDRITKLKVYRKAGVKEYWIVYPEEQYIDVYILINDMYTINTYDRNETIPVSIFPGFEINIKDIFQEQEIDN